MRDEAKHTASHQSFSAWPSGDAKLRQKPVTFVSAGVIEPLKEEKLSDDTPNPDMSEEFPGDAVEVVGDTTEAANAENIATETIQIETTVETVEQEDLTAKLPGQPVGGLDQPAISEVSETKELFFFDLAENEPIVDPSIPPPKIPSPRSSSAGSDSSDEVILFRGRTANGRGAAPRHEGRPLSAAINASQKSTERHSEATISGSKKPGSQNPTPATQLLRKRSRSRRGRSQALKAVKNEDGDEDEDAILADYIANMAADSDGDLVASNFLSLSGHRDLGGDDNAVNFGFTNEKSPKGDDTLDEGEESMESGVSDEDVDGFMNREDNQDMDADMDDETLARLLAKQEELGMGDDDLLLFTSSFAKAGTRKAQGKRPANAGSSRGLREPASANQVADAFDNLDLADWGHLTGQIRKRRSKQPPNFNVSDSEIETALRTAWQRDRERKKSRKLERETLRSEGLLDKNANPDDLRVKYLSGMKLDDIKRELTSFLVSSTERLEFPPLDKHARKVLHELANKFNVKSQSTGKGDQRRPVLYRTNRTVRYASTRVEDAASHVDQAAARIHRKYFHRVDVNVQRTESPRNAGGGRSGPKALTLREGEIVGASVPELGQENKGRSMLEKMGWSKGMSLGALDNDGILEPVAQVMKRSKAGLG